MVRYRVGIIGRFGFGKNLLNGQTVKTKIVSSALEKSIGKDDIYQVDTYGGIKALLRLPFQCIWTAIRCKNVIILPAHKGIRVIAPVLAVSNIILGRKLHYIVIGGWINNMLDGKPFLSWCLKKFDGIYVETRTMQKQLADRNFQNVNIMPNFKDLTPVSADDLVYTQTEPFRLCTFSRVMREKGIEEAVEAVKAVNNHYGRPVYTLDIYGQVDSKQTGWFEECSSTFPDYIRYCGEIPYDKSVDILKGYTALLFPTKFYTEGIPGTIIDAFAAGVPVIASMWESYSDMIDERTGIGYPFGDPQALVAILAELVDAPELLSSKKTSCLDRSVNYSTEHVIGILLEKLR